MQDNIQTTTAPNSTRNQTGEQHVDFCSRKTNKQEQRLQNLKEDEQNNI